MITKSFGAVRLPKSKIEGMRKTLRDYQPRYVAYVNDDGTGSLLYAVSKLPGCGCTITGNGTLQLPFMIVFCKAHRKVKP